MVRFSAMVDVGDAVAPPLQPDLSGDRLADALRSFRHLVIEGIQRPEMGAQLAVCEQGRQIAIVVGAPKMLIKGCADGFDHAQQKGRPPKRTASFSASVRSR